MKIYEDGENFIVLNYVTSVTLDSIQNSVGQYNHYVTIHFIKGSYAIKCGSYDIAKTVKNNILNRIKEE